MSRPELEAENLKAELLARSQELGFFRMGVACADADLALDGRLQNFVEQKRHGTMQWFADTAEVRLNVRHPKMLPSAQSVIVLVAPFLSADEKHHNTQPAIARYAQRRDYHHVVGKRIQKLCKVLRQKGYQTRGGTDALPIWERAWAERAGVGFIGKNCMLIVPGLGSHVLLACIVTSAELPSDQPMRERCGTCTLCLHACPTNAFVAPRELDARRCISYLTIESSVAPPARQASDALPTHLFGCDACQDVCPFNQSSLVAPVPGLTRRRLPTIAEFAHADPDSWRETIRGTPLTRRSAHELQAAAQRMLAAK